MQTSFPRVPSGLMNILLGLVFILAVVGTGLFFYFKDLKPRISAEQELVNKSYTFTVLCDVKQPITGMNLGWLEDAWTYNIGCVVEDKKDIEIISNGVKNLLPEPQPGLHFLVVADSAPISLIDWEKQFRDGGSDVDNPNANLPSSLKFYAVTHPNMHLYMLYLKPQFADTKIKFLCRETLVNSGTEAESQWRPYYLCSSN